MGNAKKTSKKEQYKTYKNKNTYSKNRLRKLTRHILKHDNDNQAKEALTQAEKSGFKYRRNSHASISY